MASVDTAETKVARLFIVDEQPLFRQGIRSSLSHVDDIEIAGEAEIDESALPAIETSLPDVVLLGNKTSFADSVAMCRSLKQRLPSVAVIMLSPGLYPDDELFLAIKAQASAYLSRNVNPDELVKVIRRCAAGEHPINENIVTRPRVAEQILQQFQDLSAEKETASFISPLTPRETEVLHLMAEGYLNKQIADKLSVSEQTIKNHITSILRKLNANARTQAVVIAIQKGLVSIGPVKQ